VVHGLLACDISLNDLADRPPRGLADDEVMDLGGKRVRFLPTPHVPHGWDAGVLFEESEQTLFCSDLFHQWGLHKPATEASIMERCKDTLLQSEAGPFANYVPYTHHTGRVLETLAGYRPKTLATMHGSCYYGDGAQALRDLAVIMHDVLGPKAQEGETTSIGTIHT